MLSELHNQSIFLKLCSGIVNTKAFYRMVNTVSSDMMPCELMQGTEILHKPGFLGHPKRTVRYPLSELLFPCSVSPPCLKRKNTSGRDLIAKLTTG